MLKEVTRRHQIQGPFAVQTMPNADSSRVT